ncbi:Glycosyl transferase family 31, partial [Trinorchestia longiramus]
NVFLVILILSAPKNFKLRNVIRQSWLKEESKDCLHYFAIGTDGLSEDLNVTIQSEQKRFSDMLLLQNLEDSYHSLTQKLLSSLVFLRDNINYRFVLKVDDDSYVQLDKLLFELKAIPYKLRVYWGFFDGRASPMKKGSWKEENWLLCDRYLPYALGGGYVLSHDLVEFVASNSKWLQLYNNEDVSLAVWLAPLQLHRIHDTRFDTEYMSRGCHNDYIVTHKQTVNSMRDKFNHLQVDGTMCKSLVKLRSSYNYNWKVRPSQCCIRNDSSIP